MFNCLRADKSELTDRFFRDIVSKRVIKDTGRLEMKVKPRIQAQALRVEAFRCKRERKKDDPEMGPSKAKQRLQRYKTSRDRRGKVSLMLISTVTTSH
jgi:hypothetical protein